MSNAYIPLEELSAIPKLAYIGYLWFDNEDAPKKINGKFDFSTVQQLPFIIEGNLKARDGSISISIRFVDGEYIIGQVNWQEVANQNIQLVPHRYIGHGFDRETTLIFAEALLPVKDPYCDNMEVLTPAWIALDKITEV